AGQAATADRHGRRGGAVRVGDGVLEADRDQGDGRRRAADPAAGRGRQAGARVGVREAGRGQDVRDGEGPVVAADTDAAESDRLAHGQTVGRVGGDGDDGARFAGGADG